MLLEGLFLKPDGEGKFPGVVYLHGHRSNAWSSSWIGYFLTQAGFAVFLPTQLGYDFSEGTPDFCGPTTVGGVIDGIKVFLKQKYVDPERLAVWGISRGAKVAATIATKEPGLFCAAVFQSGGYDMKSEYESIKIPGIRDAFLKETDGSERAFQERSPLHNMERLGCPALILHGESDERISVEQAKMLDKRLTELGKKHRTVIVPKSGHFITKETMNSITIPFLGEYLLTKQNPRPQNA